MPLRFWNFSIDFDLLAEATEPTMPSSQLKRAEQSIAKMREADLSPEAADALEEIVGAVRSIEKRLTDLDKANAPATAAMALPNGR